MFAYTVTATFADSRVADEWITWLRNGHIGQVLEGGAIEAAIVRLDDEPCRCEIRYKFASRAIFEAYQRDHAPRLRAEGLKLFPPESGVQLQRTTGEFVAIITLRL